MDVCGLVGGCIYMCECKYVCLYACMLIIINITSAVPVT